MRHLHRHVTAATLADVLEEIRAFAPNLVVFFAGSEIFADPALLAGLDTLEGATVIGCSTAGEIGAEGVSSGGISLLAIAFDSARVRSASARIESAADSADAGSAVARELSAPDLKAVIAFSPGVSVNGTHLVEGLHRGLGPEVVVSGGLAGDGTRFTTTHTYLGGVIDERRMVAVGLYGDSLVAGSGSEGGWSSFGPRRRVTRSEANILFELDHAPALGLYRQYLGEHAENLPGSGLLYPFAILGEGEDNGLIRTILNIDREAGSLILAGDLPENGQVCLMHSDTESLAEGARIAASTAHPAAGTAGGVALLISCVGRRLVMGSDVEEEVDAVTEVLGKDVPLAGFYSYGEIGPYASSGRTELHNQTMTVTWFDERPAA